MRKDNLAQLMAAAVAGRPVAIQEAAEDDVGQAHTRIPEPHAARTRQVGGSQAAQQPAMHRQAAATQPAAYACP